MHGESAAQNGRLRKRLVTLDFQLDELTWFFGRRLPQEEVMVPRQVQQVRDRLGIGAAELEKREKDVDATYVIARDGLKTVSLGHGKTKSAVPIETKSAASSDYMGRALQRIEDAHFPLSGS